jgi:hypothetical protein
MKLYCPCVPPPLHHQTKKNPLNSSTPHVTLRDLVMSALGSTPLPPHVRALTHACTHVRMHSHTYTRAAYKDAMAPLSRRSSPSVANLRLSTLSRSLGPAKRKETAHTASGAQACRERGEGAQEWWRGEGGGGLEGCKGAHERARKRDGRRQTGYGRQGTGNGGTGNEGVRVRTAAPLRPVRPHRSMCWQVDRAVSMVSNASMNRHRGGPLGPVMARGGNLLCAQRRRAQEGGGNIHGPSHAGAHKHTRPFPNSCTCGGRHTPGTLAWGTLQGTTMRAAKGGLRREAGGRGRGTPTQSGATYTLSGMGVKESTSSTSSRGEDESEYGCSAPTSQAHTAPSAHTHQPLQSTRRQCPDAGREHQDASAPMHTQPAAHTTQHAPTAPWCDGWGTRTAPAWCRPRAWLAGQR